MPIGGEAPPPSPRAGLLAQEALGVAAGAAPDRPAAWRRPGGSRSEQRLATSTVFSSSSGASLNSSRHLRRRLSDTALRSSAARGSGPPAARRHGCTPAPHAPRTQRASRNARRWSRAPPRPAACANSMTACGVSVFAGPAGALHLEIESIAAQILPARRDSRDASSSRPRAIACPISPSAPPDRTIRPLSTSRCSQPAFQHRRAALLAFEKGTGHELGQMPVTDEILAEEHDPRGAHARPPRESRHRRRSAA